MRGGGPNRYQPAIAGMAILPVLFVLRAATADDVQHEDEHSQQGADRDGHVERIEIAVDVSFEVGILQICGTFVYRGHGTTTPSGPGWAALR